MRHGCRFFSALCIVFISAGCGSVSVRNKGLPEGPVSPGGEDIKAALVVENRVNSSSRSTRYFWGVTYVTRAEEVFERLLQDSFGREETDLKVLKLDDGERSASGFCGSAADLQQILEEAGRQGADYLFSVCIDSCYQSYVLFVQWTGVRFSITCRSVSSGRELWHADASRRKWYASSRNVAREALYEVLTEVPGFSGREW